MVQMYTHAWYRCTHMHGADVHTCMVQMYIHAWYRCTHMHGTDVHTCMVQISLAASPVLFLPPTRKNRREEKYRASS